MKHALLCFSILLSVAFAKAQEEPKVFTFVEQMPEFPGGDGALIKFLQTNIRYPEMERDNDIQGKVLMRFVVMEDGKVADVQVLRGVSPGLDKEAKRVLEQMPNFKPGRQQGKAVRVYYNIPIVFKLQDDKPKENVDFTDKLNKDENFRAAVEQLKSGKAKDAIKSLKKSIKKFPNDYLGYELRAECALTLGKKKDACADYKLALQKGSPHAGEILNKNCN